MQIDILQANRDDLETILQIQRDCYMTEAEIYNDYNIQPLLQDLTLLENEFENTVILKGVIDGEIVGSVRGFLDRETAYIGKLIVKKDFQNEGIGRLLLEAIESTFQKSIRFELFTGFKSQKNLYFYNKLGYKEFKRQMINDNLVFIYLEKQNE